MVPLPPGRLLTLIGTGDHLFSSMMPVIIRIMLSVPPPGAKGTTTSMFLDGYLAWARAAPGLARSDAADTAASARTCLKSIPDSCGGAVDIRRERGTALLGRIHFSSRPASPAWYWP
jgi:hypothetical protein